MFHSSPGSTARFSRDGEKYNIYFADNSLLFPAVKVFSKLVNSYCEKFDTLVQWLSVTSVRDNNDVTCSLNCNQLCLTCLSPDWQFFNYMN